MNWRALSLILCLASSSVAQNMALRGDYSGVLGPLHLKLHLKAGGDGALTGTLDSVDQNAKGLPCANLHAEGKTFTFDVPSVGGKWRGVVSDDGTTLAGTWSQGADIPLTFVRDDAFSGAVKPSRVDGIWLGALGTGDRKLRIQVQIKSDHSGKEHCSIDSLDQGAADIPCDEVHFEGSQFSFKVPAVNGRWSGTLSEDGNGLNGTWNQGKDQQLNLTRQTSAIALKGPEPPKYDSGMAPVSVDGMKAVLDRDLAEALKSGALAPPTGGGVVIGVIQHGVRKVFAYGAAKENSIFEIGSITKTFTGLILAQMVEQGKVKLEDPVRTLLPDGTVAKLAGTEVTLLDLATQHSGLPRMPDNFHPASNDDPYADYAPANLYEFVGKHGLVKPADAGFNYSNLGFGLLGQALANKASVAYPELLQREVAAPLGLKDTTVKLSADQQARFIAGHDGQHRPAHAWSLDAMAGAGAIRSTGDDMLTYLQAQLHPDTVKTNGPVAATMPGALKLSHELHADAFPGTRISLAWLFNTKEGNYWHNGATGGYSSYAFFNPKEDYAAVVLYNASIDAPMGSFADKVGEHVGERLAGKPAVMLGL